MIHPIAREDRVGCGADQRCRRIDLTAQDHRARLRQEIAYHAATGSGHHSEKGHDDEGRPVLLRDMGANDREGGEADGVGPF